MSQLLHLENDLQELFVDLHASGLWKDGKEISDAITKTKPSEILSAYRSEKTQPDFDIKAFFERFFSKAPSRVVNYQSDTSAPVEDHINKLWEILSRTPTGTDFYSSLVQLPHPYVVPGGRFNEIYYWDSYFTMLGLAVSGRVDMIEDMVDGLHADEAVLRAADAHGVDEEGQVFGINELYI